MFSKAKADASEKGRLEEGGLRYFEDEDRQWFDLPCRFSKNGLCTIYERQRFAICTSYSCKLLDSYHVGEIDLDEAFARIRQAQALRSAVAAEEPAAARFKDRHELRAMLGRTKERPLLQLNMTALEFCLDKYFRSKPIDRPEDDPEVSG